MIKYIFVLQLNLIISKCGECSCQLMFYNSFNLLGMVFFSPPTPQKKKKILSRITSLLPAFFPWIILYSIFCNLVCQHGLIICEFVLDMVRFLSPFINSFFQSKVFRLVWMWGFCFVYLVWRFGFCDLWGRNQTTLNRINSLLRKLFLRTIACLCACSMRFLIHRIIFSMKWVKFGADL